MTLENLRNYLETAKEKYPISTEFTKNYQQSPANKNGYVLTVDASKSLPYQINCNFERTEYYGAEGGGNRIRQEFLDENRVSGAIYEEAQEGESEDLPREFTLCIRSEEELSALFSEIPQELAADFESEMLVVYSAANEYRTRPIALKSVGAENEKLEIWFEITLQRGTGSASVPAQMYLFVKMDKLDVSAIACEISYKSV